MNRPLSYKSPPERAKLFFLGDRAPEDSILLPLPPRKLWPVGLVLGIFFILMASIEYGQIASLHGRKMETIFDLSTFLFQFFWILGWSVGVFILGALTALFLFYGEAARIQDGQLFYCISLGPLCLRAEYALDKIQNLRLEKVTEMIPSARIQFDYGSGITTLGDVMPKEHAEKLIRLIQSAPSSRLPAGQVRREAPHLDLMKLFQNWISKRLRQKTGTVVESKPAAAFPPPKWTSPSSLFLILANFYPLAGVIFWGWSIADIMVLFWAESAVIGFYNVLKMIVVGKWAALFAAPFFTGHYGGFMAGHFLFVYLLFVRGAEASGPEQSVGSALATIFIPIWPALLMLFLSHGISFVMNFLKRKEYAGMSLGELMGSPYSRIFIMHITIIFGGWLVMSFHSPLPGLVLLIFIKAVADLRAHLKQHAN